MVVGDGKGWWSQARKRGAAVGGLAALGASSRVVLGGGWCSRDGGGVMNRNDKAGAPLLPVAAAGWWDVWPR